MTIPVLWFGFAGEVRGGNCFLAVHNSSGVETPSNVFQDIGSIKPGDVTFTIWIKDWRNIPRDVQLSIWDMAKGAQIAQTEPISIGTDWQRLEMTGKWENAGFLRV
ncbi:MAG: hypothetical protein AAF702_36695 [Chloroflexota bacterium]